MQGNARRLHIPRQCICWISCAERRPLRKAQLLLSGAAGLMAKVYADVLLALEEECGIMVSKRILRDLIVEASGAETKQTSIAFYWSSLATVCRILFVRNSIMLFTTSLRVNSPSPRQESQNLLHPARGAEA